MKKCENVLTEAGGVVECEVVHHSGTKETPPEEEILSTLLHGSTALLPGLDGDKAREEGQLRSGPLQGKHKHPSRRYLDDFVLHDGVQPLDERLHRGVLSQQLLQLLKDGDGVIWKKGTFSFIRLVGSFLGNTC